MQDLAKLRLPWHVCFAQQGTTSTEERWGILRPELRSKNGVRKLITICQGLDWMRADDIHVEYLKDLAERTSTSAVGASAPASGMITGSGTSSSVLTATGSSSPSRVPELILETLSKIEDPSIAMAVAEQIQKKMGLSAGAACAAQFRADQVEKKKSRWCDKSKRSATRARRIRPGGNG